jgi:hypothetical protein
MMTIKTNSQTNRQLLRNALGMMLLTAIAMGIAGRTILSLQHDVCPQYTFLVGTVSQGLDAIVIFVAAVLVILLVRPYFNDLTARVKHRDESTTDLPRGRFYAGLIAAGLFVPAYAWVCWSQYCATPDGLYVRRTPTQSLQRYGWEQVATIKTECQIGARRSAITAFKVTMADGERFDLVDGPSYWLWTPSKSFPSAYPALARALHGRPFRFDAHDVLQSCPTPDRRLFANRP